MNVYAVTGFDNPDDSTNWEIFGIYTSREQAENCLISLAHNKVEDMKKYNHYYDGCVSCWYNSDDELKVIDDTDNEFYLAIYKRELKGE